MEINSSTRVSGDSGWIPCSSATTSQPGLGCWWLFIWLFGFIFVFPLFWGRASWSPGWSQACSVAKNDLELPSWLPSAVTGGVCQPSWLEAEPASEPRALHVLDKQSSKGDRPQPRCWALSHQLVQPYSAPAPNSYLNTSPQPSVLLKPWPPAPSPSGLGPCVPESIQRFAWSPVLWLPAAWWQIPWATCRLPAHLPACICTYVCCQTAILPTEG